MSQASLSLPPVERVTLNEQVYLRLKRALLAGRIEPGSTLTLRQLADDLGTSMMPVREAITRLSAEQAVEVLPNRGIRVPQLSEADAEDLWKLRIQLEGDACARAAHHASTAQARAIRRGGEAVERAGKKNDLHAVLDANSDYQFMIYAAADSPILLQLIEILRMKSVPHCTGALRAMLRERPPYFLQAWQNHTDLSDAIAAGDGPRACHIKQNDLREFRNYVNSVRKRSP